MTTFYLKKQLTLLSPVITLVVCSSFAYVLRLPVLQTTLTQIRLLQEEQSDQGSYCELPHEKILSEVYLNIVMQQT